MSLGCLDESTVVAFLDGALPRPEQAAAEAHLASCEACMDLTTWAATDRANRSRAPGQERRPFIAQLASGSRVGRYQILGVLGRGGMGEVYAAYHPDLDRRIALKIVYEAGVITAARHARLLREARAIARLTHPNVVAVYDAGIVDDRVYIAMEYVDGATLDAWRREAPRSWREVLDVFVAAGRGLAAAHAAGIVHRDFKPQNVMLGKNGSVRVMDFGLARLVLDELDAPPDVEVDVDAGVTSGDRSPATDQMTKTGALVGTPAYMAPEQFRGEPIDARADQFAFCVALHEALYGTRPALDHLRASEDAADRRDADEAPGRAAPSDRTSHASVPSWLKRLVRRGLSVDRERRFPSVERLLVALDRGRNRRRRRLTLAVAGLVACASVAVAWRQSRAPRVDCTPAENRIAAAWSPDGAGDARRAAVHRAFAASGRADAEGAWQQLSSALDAYMGNWTATYRDACAATQIRGDQSGEVMDLRMQCLGENLDEVRALTDALASTQPSAISQATIAAAHLAPVARCSDIPALRSAVPLPRDNHTLQAVQALRRSINDVNALLQLYQNRDALKKATALRGAVEATGYRPLLAQLLAVMGDAQVGINAPEAETTLEQALFEAEAGRDDETAARAAVELVYEVGYSLARLHDGERWANLASAILTRLGPGHALLRGWLSQNRGIVAMQEGDLQAARRFFADALVLKENALGPDDPDVARSHASQGWTEHEAGNDREALVATDRGLAICARRGIPCGGALMNRGEILLALGRYDEAETTLQAALVEVNVTNTSREAAHVLNALGELRIARGDPAAGIPFLKQALAIREQSEPNLDLLAITRFSLARGLWDSGGDRHRARALAMAAADGFAAHARPWREKAARDWLADHARAH